MRILIGVGAVIEDEGGRILLVKHRKERGGYWQGKWICPGGELELGETIEEGIRREVREETGLEIELRRALPAFDRVVRSGGEVSLHVVYIDYLAGVTGGELKADSDIDEAVWLAKEKLPALWEELHEDTKRLLMIAEMVDAI